MVGGILQGLVLPCVPSVGRSHSLKLIAFVGKDVELPHSLFLVFFLAWLTWKLNCNTLIPTRTSRHASQSRAAQSRYDKAGIPFTSHRHLRS